MFALGLFVVCDIAALTIRIPVHVRRSCAHLQHPSAWQSRYDRDVRTRRGIAWPKAHARLPPAGLVRIEIIPEHFNAKGGVALADSAPEHVTVIRELGISCFPAPPRKRSRLPLGRMRSRTRGPSEAGQLATQAG